MYEKKLPENYECGISIANRVLGGKWNAWLLDCINRGVRRPTEIHKQMSEANPRVLNMALRELTTLKILYKVIHHEQPLRVEYFLTDLGQSTLPLIDAMDKWGSDHREEILSATAN